MAGYASSVGVQIGRYEREVRAYLHRAFRSGGRDIRRAVVRDRFSKPKKGPGIGLSRKTGRAARSVEYAVFDAGPSSVQLEMSAGRRRAWYVALHEEEGRLGFRDYVARKYRDLLDSIRTGILFLTGRPSFAGAGADPSASAGGDLTGLADEAREAVLARHFGARTDFRGLGLAPASGARPRRRRKSGGGGL
jgi:hypothetical protein